jgi:hypothetical protein
VEKEKMENLRADHTILPCEWEGELLGYFCIEKAARKIRRSSEVLAKNAEKNQKTEKKRKEVKKRVRRSSSTSTSTEDAPENSREDSAENETLKVLGPQAMGLLVPGVYGE